MFSFFKFVDFSHKKYNLNSYFEQYMISTLCYVLEICLLNKLNSTLIIYHGTLIMYHGTFSYGWSFYIIDKNFQNILKEYLYVHIDLFIFPWCSVPLSSTREHPTRKCFLGITCIVISDMYTMFRSSITQQCVNRCEGVN